MLNFAEEKSLKDAEVEPPYQTEQSSDGTGQAQNYAESFGVVLRSPRFSVVRRYSLT